MITEYEFYEELKDAVVKGLSGEIRSVPEVYCIKTSQIKRKAEGCNHNSIDTIKSYDIQ